MELCPKITKHYNKREFTRFRFGDVLVLDGAKSEEALNQLAVKRTNFPKELARIVIVCPYGYTKCPKEFDEIWPTCYRIYTNPVGFQRMLQNNLVYRQALIILYHLSEENSSMYPEKLVDKIAREAQDRNWVVLGHRWKDDENYIIDDDKIFIL
jgi:hypothetical protein